MTGPAENPPYRRHTAAAVLLTAVLLGALVFVGIMQMDDSDAVHPVQSPLMDSPDAAAIERDRRDASVTAIDSMQATDTQPAHDDDAAVAVGSDTSAANSVSLGLEMPDMVHGFCMCHPFGMMQALRAAVLRVPAADSDVAESTDRGIYRFFSGENIRGVGARRDTGPVQ